MKWYELINKKQQICFAFLIIISQLFFALIQQPTLNDPFHTGEYFASATHFLLTNQSNFQTIQIHGIADLLPAILAESIWGSDYHFLPTLTFYKLLDFISYVLLISAIFQIGLKSKESLLIFIFVLVAGHNFVSFRDTILLLCINMFIALQGRKLDPQVSYCLHILFGIVVAFSIFWSFDRGIAGVFSLGIASLFASLRDKKFIISMLTFFVFIPLLSYAHDIFSIQKYIENILILFEASSEWSYGLSISALTISTISIFINFSAISLCFISLISKNTNNKNLELKLLFFVLSLFLLKIGINRADLDHLYMSLWVPIIILIITLGMDFNPSNHTRIFNYWSYMTSAAFIFVLVIPFFGQNPYTPALVVLSFLAVLFKMQRSKYLEFINSGFVFIILFMATQIINNNFLKVVHNDYRWIFKLKSPPPNIQMATDGVLWASNQISKNNNPCVFDLSNNGIINALVKLPSCTTFTYPVYAAPKHEDELIQQLKNSGVKSIVYSSTYWSYSIDGKNMATRFPRLDEYILNNFDNEKCKFGYCVRVSQ